MRYDKPPLTFEQQCDLLLERGLEISDSALAVETLSHLNYYRLSAYFLPFQSQKDRFNLGTRLEDVLTLYEFDRRLCLWLTEVLAEVEIGIRTQLAYYLAHKVGAFGYTDPGNFSGDFGHQDWLKKVQENVDRSHETFVEHFRTKYTSEGHLPVWMVCEVISFGQISQLYRGLRRHDGQAIAKGVYGVDQVLLSSWLHALVYVRNLCAHHSRVWNRTLSIRPKKPRGVDQWEAVRNDKLFCVMCVTRQLIRMKGRWEQLLGKLLTLLGEFSGIDVRQMGFLANWQRILTQEEGRP